MVEWHLFANKPLLNVVPEGQNFSESDIYYGRIPQEFVDMEFEQVKELVNHHMDLVNFEKKKLSFF
jgi:hypothetical protein